MGSATAAPAVNVRAAADADIARFLAALFRPGEVFEVRSPKTPDRPGGRFTATISGYFDNPAKAAREVSRLDASGRPPAIYCLLNPCKQELLARAHNRLRDKAAETTGDDQIIHRRHFLIDADANRESGISSTDEEMAAACAVAGRIRADLSAAGWPDGIETMSGNGAGVVYRIDLPNTEESEALLDLCLKALAHLYDAGSVTIDQTVKNAARITKIPGTVARKGDDFPGTPTQPPRPHRRSFIEYMPEGGLRVVPRELLERLAAKAPKEEPAPERPAYHPTPRANGNGRPAFDSFDHTAAGVRGYLERHHVVVKGEHLKGGSTFLHLERCPVNPSCESGGDNDIAVVVNGGKISYLNLHDRGDGLQWEDVRESLEPGYRQWVTDSRNARQEADELADVIHKDLRAGEGDDATRTRHLRRLNEIGRGQYERVFERLGARHGWDCETLANLDGVKKRFWHDSRSTNGNGNGHPAASDEPPHSAAPSPNGEHPGPTPGNEGKPPPPLPVIPLDSAIPPPLPLSAFEGWVGDMIQAVSESRETPPNLAAFFALGTLATVTQGRFSVKVGAGADRNAHFENLAVWPCCAMESGNRKTGVMSDMTAPLLEWSKRLAAEAEPEIKRLASERRTADKRVERLRTEAVKATSPDDYRRLAAEIAEMEKSLPEVPAQPTVFTDDCTPEHLATLMGQNGERMGIISDEGGVLDMMGGRYSANSLPNLDIYLKGHAGSHVQVHRGNRPPVTLYHPSLVVCISPQPDVLRGLAGKPGFRGRGLLARFAYSLPQSRIGFRQNNGRPVPESVSQCYSESVMRLASVRMREHDDKLVPHTLTLDPDARAVWDRFWAQNEVTMRPGDRMEELKDWGSKLPGLVARCAALLHLTDYTSDATNTRTITAGTMSRAATLGRYLIDHALIAFDLMGGCKDREKARKLWRQAEKQAGEILARDGRVTGRDLWQNIRNTQGYETMKAVDGAFGLLVEHGYLIEPGDGVAPARPGPKGRLFYVSPLILAKWRAHGR